MNGFADIVCGADRGAKTGCPDNLRKTRNPRTLAALAPMAGIADRAYRLIAKSFGACYVTSEMASCKAIVYGDEKTAELLKMTEAERPYAVQLFGSEPEYFEKAIRLYLRGNAAPDIIDINAGCPVPKVVKDGAGSALMKNPRLLGSITEAAVRASSIPVTVKIRAGWDGESVNAPQAAAICESAGAAAITVHGRTREQYYGGRVDRDVIAETVQAVKIPVIASGDVACAKTAAEMYGYTNCALVTVGRGSYGRPWVFAEIAGGSDCKIPSCRDEILEVCRRHIELLVTFKGEYRGIREARRQAAYYFKSMQGAPKLRLRAGEMETLKDFYALLEYAREF